MINHNHHHSIPRATALAAALAVALAGCASHSQARALPAQTPPPGLKAGHAQIAWFASAAAVANPVAEQDSRFDVALPARASDLTQVALRWRAWFDAPVADAYTFVVAIDGPRGAVAAVRVDGQQPPVAAAIHGGGVTTTTAGSVRLARGWHEIVIAAGGTLAMPRDTVTLSIRAPGASAAVPLVPYWPIATTTTH